MKNPTLIFAITVILFLFFGVVNGQTPHEKPDKAARLTAAMNKRLQLDDTQLQQITLLNQETAVSLKQTNTQSFESRQEKRAAIRQIWTQHNAQVKSILNEQQWTAFIALKQELKARQQQRRKVQFRKRRMMARRGHRPTENQPATEPELTEEDLEDLGGMDLFEDLDDEF